MREDGFEIPDNRSVLSCHYHKWSTMKPMSMRKTAAQVTMAMDTEGQRDATWQDISVLLIVICQIHRKVHLCGPSARSWYISMFFGEGWVYILIGWRLIVFHVQCGAAHVRPGIEAGGLKYMLSLFSSPCRNVRWFSVCFCMKLQHNKNGGPQRCIQRSWIYSWILGLLYNWDVCCARKITILCRRSLVDYPVLLGNTQTCGTWCCGTGT